MFIESLQTDPAYYFTAVITLIFSIVLHELAHGWVAMWQGDDTPRVLGHLTPNPITHMGGLGFVAVFVLGMGWGAMPVNPSRFRSRYGDAMVSVAGPLMNLLLCLIGLTAFALWGRHIPQTGIDPFRENMANACLVFGMFNMVLVLLNLIPVPPLDGSSVLADFSRGYANWLRETEQHHLFMLLALFGVLSALGRTPYGLFPLAAKFSLWYVGLFGT